MKKFFSEKTLLLVVIFTHSTFFLLITHSISLVYAKFCYIHLFQQDNIWVNFIVICVGNRFPFSFVILVLLTLFVNIQCIKAFLKDSENGKRIFVRNFCLTMIILLLYLIPLFYITNRFLK
jgi:hypothetical protein